MDGIQDCQKLEFAQSASLLTGIENAKEILLTQEKVALVDEDDYERIKQYRWWAMKGNSTYYAERYDRGVRIKMHRDILGLPPSPAGNFLVDHINRYGLDNRKQNLRLATRSLNNYNTKLRTNNHTGYRGVSKHNDRQICKYAAVISKDGVRYDIGRFYTAEEAALAYDREAFRLYGKDALLNFSPRRME